MSWNNKKRLLGKIAKQDYNKMPKVKKISSCSRNLRHQVKMTSTDSLTKTTGSRALFTELKA